MAGLLLSPAVGCDSPAPTKPVEPAIEADAASEPTADRARVVAKATTLMGTRFSIQVWTKTPDEALVAVDAAFAEVARVETLISEWQPTSEISAVNDSAGGDAQRVGPELLEVVRAAVEVSKESEGAFDITFASCGRYYSTSKRKRPTEAELASCLPRIGYQAIEIDAEASTIRLAAADVRIGVGGIGKGYGVDRAADVLAELGFRDFVVDGGGDLRVRGKKGPVPWGVGIQHPRKADASLGVVIVDDAALVSSGDYERFYEESGVRYHHIIDPTTGRSASRAIHTTVIAPTAMEADALATAIFVLGPGDGIALADRLEGVEALVIDPAKKQHMSRGFSWFVAE